MQQETYTMKTQHEKDLEIVARQEKELEKHNSTPITVEAYSFEQLYQDHIFNSPDSEDGLVDIELQDFTCLFCELSNDAILELIKSLIWMGGETTLNQVSKLIKSKEFKETID